MVAVVAFAHLQIGAGAEQDLEDAAAVGEDRATKRRAAPPVSAVTEIRVVERFYGEGAHVDGIMRMRFDAAKEPDGGWRPRDGWVSALGESDGRTTVLLAPRRPERVVTIELRDITSLEVDAIVCPGYLLDGSLAGDADFHGVLGAVHRAAGRRLVMACAATAARLKSAGEADEADAEARDFGLRRVVVTGGFDLKAKAILLTEVKYDARPPDDCIAEQLARCLDVAAERDHRSVAAPMLGTGVSGAVGLDVAARGCVAGLLRWYAGCPPHLHLPKGTDVRAKPPPKVTICVFPDDRSFETISALVAAADRARLRIATLPTRFVEERQARAAADAV